MEAVLQRIAAFTPAGTVQWTVAIVALAASLFAFLASRDSELRITDRRNEQDTVMGLMTGAVLGALTGLLWVTWNPVKIVPPYIHLRVFSFFIPLIGILFGRGTGFVAGYVATLVWAPLAGAFVPLHSPIADGIFVGLTGWIPAYLLRGDRTNAELLEQIQENSRAWYLKCAIVNLFAGLFMSFFVAFSLEVTTPLPFWLSFWAIGVISDTGPMILFTAPAVHMLLGATRRSWSWMPQF